MKNAFKSAALEIGTFFTAPSAKQVQCLMVAFGVTLLICGMHELSYAKTVEFDVSDTKEGFAAIIGVLLFYLEGPFGALLMIIAGIGAVFAAALGSYKAALSLLIVAIGCFVLRSLLVGFFGQDIIVDPTGA